MSESDGNGRQLTMRVLGPCDVWVQVPSFAPYGFLAYMVKAVD